MVNVDQLSDEQKQAMTHWVEQGSSLKELQKQLRAEFDLRVTYMETRFLVADLGLEIQSETIQEEPLKEEDSQSISEVEEKINGASSIQLEVYDVKQPGSLLNGRVTFSDGEVAQWALDQMGRLSLNAETTDYQPSEEDVADFQVKLKEQMSLKS